jgi:hypothetical protein
MKTADCKPVDYNFPAVPPNQSTQQDIHVYGIALSLDIRTIAAQRIVKWHVRNIKQFMF